VLEENTKRDPKMKRVTHAGLLAIAYLGFISLGLPDTVIGVAWPSVRDSFQLQQSTVALIFFGAGSSYFFSSFFTGRLLGKLGIGMLLAASSALVALSAFGYGFAPFWITFALCSVIHGLGSGAIDAGLNHYVAHHFPARHMTWLHACYTLGATLGPLVMTTVIAWYGAWRIGYLVVACTLLALAIVFVFTRRRWDDHGNAINQPSRTASMTETLRHPVVRLQSALFFVYTGLEMTAGQWSFTLLTEARGVPHDIAGLWVTGYWGSIFSGRVISGFVVERIGIDRLLRWSMIAVMVGASLLAWDPAPWTAAPALAVTGFGLASIYPCLMTRTPQRVGSLAAHAIGFQVSASIAGGAALPSVSGFLAQNFGLETVSASIVAMAFTTFVLHELLLRWAPER
jgi:fucose permease